MSKRKIGEVDDLEGLETEIAVLKERLEKERLGGGYYKEAERLEIKVIKERFIWQLETELTIKELLLEKTQLEASNALLKEGLVKERLEKEQLDKDRLNAQLEVKELSGKFETAARLISDLEHDVGELKRCLGKKGTPQPCMVAEALAQTSSSIEQLECALTASDEEWVGALELLSG